MREYVADPTRGFHWTDIPYLSVARALPKKTNGDSGGHVIRSPFGYDAASGGLVFPGRLSIGDQVTIVRRDAQDIATNSIEAATALGQRHAMKRPALVLHFDCAGRGAQLYGDRTTRDLTDPVQRALGKDVPWIGFHCYGEIAPIGEKNYFHQYTMALAAIYEAGNG
jgi:small ligand-binding sensory domain FIST